MRQHPLARYFLPIACIALGAVIFAAGLAADIRVLRKLPFDDEALMFGGFATLLSSLWVLLAERLLAHPMVRLTGMGLLVAATYVVGLQADDQESTAVIRFALFGVGALFGLLALQVRHLRSKADIANRATAWVTNFGTVPAGAIVATVGFVFVIPHTGEDISKLLAIWQAGIGLAAAMLWVMLRFDRPGLRFRTLALRQTVQQLVTLGLACGGYALLMEGSGSAIITAAVLGLLALETSRENESFEPIRAFIAGALAAMALYGLTTLESKMGMMAPVGLATAFAGVVGMVAQRDDELVSYRGWAAISLGCLLGAMMP